MQIGYHPHAEKLMQNVPESDLKSILTRDPWTTRYWDAEAIRALCWPMHAVPLSGVPGFRISALSHRVRRSAILSVPAGSLDKRKDFHLADGVNVQTRYELYAAQLQSVRPDVIIEHLDLETEADPAVAFLGHHVVEGSAHHITLHPEEIVPVSGLGFYGWATREEDEEAHLWVRRFHYPESIWSNNLERGLARKWRDYRAGVHVRQENHLLRVWMAGICPEEQVVKVSGSFISQAGVEDHMNSHFQKEIERNCEAKS